MSTGIKACAWVMLAVLCTSQASHGQPPQRPLTPRQAHERLAVFEGLWTPHDTTAANLVERCSWLEGGRRHMVCSQRGNSGPGNQIVYSFQGADTTYIVTVFLRTGQVWTYSGPPPEGNRWTFELQSPRPAGSPRLRMTVTVLPDTIHFVEEWAEDGGPWRISEDYRHVRKVPARP